MTKWTTADIPDQTGRTAVITGANTGLGLRDRRARSPRKGARVVLAVRNLDKGKEAADRIARRSPGAEVAVQELDLTSLDSIRAAADELRAGHDRIDLLINNAGVMMTPEGHHRRTASSCSSAPTISATSRSPACCSTACSTSPAPASSPSAASATAFAAGIHFDDLQWERGYSRDRRLRPVQAGQPDVHLRAAAPAAPRGTHHRRRPRTPAGRAPSWPATFPGHACGVQPSASRCCQNADDGRAADAARRDRSRRPRRPVLRPRRPRRTTRLPEGRRLQRGVPRRRRRSAACGRSPRS